MTWRFRPAGAVALMVLLAAAGAAAAADEPPAAGSEEVAPATAQEEGDEAEEQYRRGLKHETGDGVVKNAALAWRWYLRAAEHGHLKAQLKLAEMYARGIAVPRNYARAAEWYRRAAEAGDVGAQAWLGRMYRRGLGVPRDDREAARWLGRAADGGDDAARDQLDEMARLGQLPRRAPAPGGEAAALSAEGEAARRAFDHMMAFLTPAAASGVEVHLGGDLRVREGEGEITVILPRMELRTGRGTTVRLGTIRVHVAPEGEATYRMTAEPPRQVVIRGAQGGEPTVLTFDDFSWNGLWSEALSALTAVDVAAAGLRAATAGGRAILSLEEGRVRSRLEESEPGLWRGLTEITGTGLDAAVAEDDAVLSLGAFTVRVRTAGSASAARRALAALGAEPGAATNEPATAPAGREGSAALPPFLRASRLEAEIEGLRATSAAGAELFALDRGRFDIAANDFDGDAGGLDLALDYDGLRAALGGGLATLVPHRVGLDLGIERLPARRLWGAMWGALAPLLAGGIGGGADRPGNAPGDTVAGSIATTAEAALLDAATVLVLRRGEVEAEGFGIRAEGHIAADREAARKLSGRFDVAVRGLDELAANPVISSLLGEKAAKLAVLSRLGEPRALPDGGTEARYRIELSGGGELLVNGVAWATALAGAETEPGQLPAP